MGDKTKIEWHSLTAAKRIGVSPSEYEERLLSGMKWCTFCKDWHRRSEFGRDATRGDGLASRCLSSKRVRERKSPERSRRGWLVPTRDGDKMQARRRVNYLVETGQIPRPDDLPCMDCADMLIADGGRHEYDHAKGYDGENQLYVEPVCQRCHRDREEARRGQAA